MGLYNPCATTAPTTRATLRHLPRRAATWETERPTSKLEFVSKHSDDPDVQEIFDLISEDGWLNVYRGELEVRPPGAPTTRQVGLPILDWTANS